MKRQAPLAIQEPELHKIFRRAATLFDYAFCRLDPIFDRVSNGFLHTLHFGSKPSRSGADICDFIGYFSFHCYSSLDLCIRRSKSE